MRHHAAPRCTMAARAERACVAQCMGAGIAWRAHVHGLHAAVHARIGLLHMPPCSIGWLGPVVPDARPYSAWSTGIMQVACAVLLREPAGVLSCMGHDVFMQRVPSMPAACMAGNGLRCTVMWCAA